MKNAMVLSMVQSESCHREHAIAMYVTKSIMPLKCHISHPWQLLHVDGHETTISVHISHMYSLQ